MKKVLFACALLLLMRGYQVTYAFQLLMSSDDQSMAHADAVHSWVDTVFAKPSSNVPPREGVFIDRSRLSVFKKRSDFGAPLKLGEKYCDRGIYMDTPASVRVTLNKPAKQFIAEVGIYYKRITQGQPDSGSARFHVFVKGKKVFSTPILKMRDGATLISVPLNGARNFTLEVDDGGDGIDCDRCLWADARVMLTDGSMRYIDDIPMKSSDSMSRRLAVPFSFCYNNQHSDSFLEKWDYSTRNASTRDGSKQVIDYKDPKTGLLIECEIKTFSDMPAVDWVFYLSNTSDKNTGIIEEFLPLDTTYLFNPDQQDVPVIRWSNGDQRTEDSFLWHDDEIKLNVSKGFSPVGGRSSNGAFPFFNMKNSDEGGWVIAVGWTGQWKMKYDRDGDALTVQAGMERTRFLLKPGERVRTPRIVLLKWNGDEMIVGHNLFRQLMLKYYVQRHNEEIAVPPVAHNTAGTIYRSGKPATEQNQLAIIEEAAKLGVEAYWMDAYWFATPWRENVGSWFCRKNDFPNGLKPLADAAHNNGMKFVLWFEPERVYEGTAIDKEYPEYLLRIPDSKDRLLNLGNTKARKFIVGLLDELIKKWNVDIYRQDFNFDPLQYWIANDAPDRQGITEMLYVEGLYKFWSALKALNPGLMIDNCASGGRRIDLETCSLSYPLWRSDWNDIGEGLKGRDYWPMMGRSDQVMLSGLALYLPFQSGPIWGVSPYCFRSGMTSSIVLYDHILDENFPADLAKAGIAELKEIRPFFEGDFYPLLKLTADQDDWYAYQFDRPDLERGCVFFFRRPESDIAMHEVTLYNIDPNAQYMVRITPETYKKETWKELNGSQLRRMRIMIEEKPGSVLLRYKRLISDNHSDHSLPPELFGQWDQQIMELGKHYGTY